LKHITSYTVYPQQFRTLIESGKIPIMSKSPFIRGLKSPYFYAFIIPMMMVGGLTLIDDLSFYAAYPLALWPGLMSTTYHFMSVEMQCPLWVARFFHFFTAYATLSTLLLMSKILEYKFTEDEERKVLRNMQRELDTQRTHFRTTG
jgi:hypothetical protein